MLPLVVGRLLFLRVLCFDCRATTRRTSRAIWAPACTLHAERCTWSSSIAGFTIHEGMREVVLLCPTRPRYIKCIREIARIVKIHVSFWKDPRFLGSTRDLAAYVDHISVQCFLSVALFCCHFFCFRSILKFLPAPPIHFGIVWCLKKFWTFCWSQKLPVAYVYAVCWQLLLSM